MKLDKIYKKSVKGQKFENYTLEESKNSFPDVKSEVWYGEIVLDPIKIGLVRQK